jgi:hypothetical protein
MIKRAGILIASFALAAGFCALIVWSLQNGVAAGKYGAATRSETPGLYWFVIVGLATMALVFIANGIKAMAPAFRIRLIVIPGFALLLPFAVWAMIELAGAFWKAILGVPELGGRVLYAGLAVMLLGVIGTLLYTLIWPEVRAIWTGESTD